MTAPREPIKVLFVMGQTAQSADGGVASLVSIVSNLAHTRAVVVTNARSAAVERLEDRCVPVFFEPDLLLGARRESAWGRAAPLRRFSSLNVKLGRLAREHAVSVVHANDLPALYSSAPAARALRIPVVWNIRGLQNVRGWKWGAGRLLADVVVALSGDMSKRIERALPRASWLPLAPLESIYSLVDTEAIHPLGEAERLATRSALGIEPDEIAVGLVAAFGVLKQQVELLEAIARRPRDRLVWHFVGDYRPDTDPYAARFREILRATPGLADRVRTPGYRSDVASYYQALDLVVVASKVEGLARCMIEGLAAGTPVVSFDVPSAREILDGYRCGRVVACDAFDELLDAAALLGADSDARRTMGAKGREAAVELFSGTKNVERYEALYRELADRSWGASRRP